MKRFFGTLIVMCFCICIFSAEYSYTKSQKSDLQAKINGKLSPGDIVYLEDGTYTDCLLTFKGNGTSSKPITLKARNAGKVIFNGQLRLQMSGTYLIVDGFVFKDGVASNSDIIEFRTSSTVFANNCRLTNCVIDNCNNQTLDKSLEKPSERWVMLYGKNNRVDHCYFARKDRSGVLMMVAIDKVEGRENNHLIDSNFFGFREKLASGNGGEIIRLGDSNTSIYSCKTTIENNFFYNCDGEVEIISLKSADNVITRNTFYECAGSVVCRHGKNNTISSNLFIGNNKSGCGGVRIINEGQKVFNNIFQELAGTGTRSALSIMTAVFENPTDATDFDKEPLNAYHRVKNVYVVHNTFVGCKSIEVGTVGSYTYSSDNPYYPKQKLTGNLYPHKSKLGSNMIYHPTSEGIVNIVSEEAIAEISLQQNLCTFSSKFTYRGFSNVKLNFEKKNGTYVLLDETATPASADYDYVATDITGKIRPSTGKNVGAIEASNRNLSYNTAKPDAVGATWYTPQQQEANSILSKTKFSAPLIASGLDNTSKDDSQLQVYCRDNTMFVNANILMSQISLYDSSGRLIKTYYPKQTIYSFDVNSLPKGMYICKIRTEKGDDLVRKVVF